MHSVINVPATVTAAAAVVWCFEKGPKMWALAVMRRSFILEGENNKSENRTKDKPKLGKLETNKTRNHNSRNNTQGKTYGGDTGDEERRMESRETRIFTKLHSRGRHTI